MPQLVPLHVALPLVGTGQGVHELPQELRLVLSAHELPQRWVPVLHTKSQAVPLQVDVPNGGGAHGLHDVPQVFTLKLLAQAVPQRWKFMLQA